MTSAPVSQATASDCSGSAKWYANRGWPVLPVHYPTNGGCSCGNPACTSVGKHPALPNGVHGATTDPGTVAAWWSNSRPWNVGLATGGPFWVLDVDGAKGKAGMAEAQSRHGWIPSTVTADTGGGGFHLLWRASNGLHVGCRVGVLPGVDVRGSGGYVVAPPSLHQSGQCYQWHQGRGPHQVTIAEAPIWLLSLALGHQTTDKPMTDWAEAFRSKVPQGERNHGVAKRAGYLLRHGIDPRVTTELLIDWVRGHCSPPLKETEIRRTVASIANCEARRRQTDNRAAFGASSESSRRIDHE